jgi:uncharacterized membrane protein YccC
MEGMQIDIRLVITVAGIIFSVAGAAAVARSQITRLTEQIKMIEAQLRQADSRSDALENTMGTNGQRLDVIAKMLSPSERDKESRMSERHEVTLKFFEKDFTRRIEHLEKIHNSAHPRTE